MTSSAVTGTATEEGKTITFTVTPSADLTADTVLSLNLTGVPAVAAVAATGTTAAVAAVAGTSANDFSVASTTLTFKAGAAAAQTVTITVANDGTTEGIEGYTATLVDANGVQRATSIDGTVTDGTGNVISLNGVATINEGESAAVYTVSVAAPVVGSALVIPYTLSGTTTGSDYSGTAGSVTIPVGSSTATITLPIIADALTEGAETLIVTLGTAPTGYVLKTDASSVTTTVNDTSVANQIALSGSTAVNEGDTAAYTISVSSAVTGTALVIPYGLTGTATVGNDFTAASATGSVTIPVGSKSATISLPVTADFLTEGAENIIVTLGTIPTGFTTKTGATSVTTAIADTSLGVAGGLFTLTSGVETKTLTSGNDTVDGSLTDSILGDTITDALATDNDILNFVTTGAVDPLAVSGVETVNATAKYGSATIDASKYTGTSVLTASSAIASGTASVNNASATSINTIKAGLNISTLMVAAGTSGTGSGVTVDAGSASAVTLTGTAGKTDVYSLIVNGGAETVNANALTETADKLTITGTKAANIVSLVNGAKTLIVAGDQDMTISGADTLFSGNTVTNTLSTGKSLTATITGTAGTADLSKVAASNFVLQGTGTSGVYTFANDSSVKIDNANATSIVGATSATAINLDLLNATPSITSSIFTIANVKANTVAVTSLDAKLGSTATLSLTGTKALCVTIIVASFRKHYERQI